MGKKIQITGLLLIAGVAICSWGLAAKDQSEGTWTGYIVDAKCYDSVSHNVNPWDASTTDRDMQYGIRYCAPTAKTKSFAVVPNDWQMLRLDAAGNAKAAALVQNAGKKPEYVVTVTGEREKDQLDVSSMAPVTRATQ